MYCNGYDRDSGFRGAMIIVILLFATIIIVISGISNYFDNYFATKEYTVTVTDKNIKNYNESSKFLVFTKLENGETKVFTIEDSWFKSRWNSADYYADIEVGKTYKIEVIGKRSPVISGFENIIEFKKLE